MKTKPPEIIEGHCTSFNFRPPIEGIRTDQTTYLELDSLITALRQAGAEDFADQLARDFA